MYYKSLNMGSGCSALVEQSLLTPEVRGSNPVIGKLLYRSFVYYQLYCKDENKHKKIQT